MKDVETELDEAMFTRRDELVGEIKPILQRMQECVPTNIIVPRQQKFFFVTIHHHLKGWRVGKSPEGTDVTLFLDGSFIVNGQHYRLVEYPGKGRYMPALMILRNSLHFRPVDSA